MKPAKKLRIYGTVLRIGWCASATAVLLLATVTIGCRTFSQVPEGEPHGVIVIQKPRSPGSTACRELRSIDGKAIPWWNRSEYRLSPGEHRVVFMEVFEFEEVYDPAVWGVGTATPAVGFLPRDEVLVDGAGGVTVTEHGFPSSGGGFDPVNLRVQERETREVEFLVNVEVGCRYELDGYTVKKMTGKGDR